MESILQFLPVTSDTILSVGMVSKRANYEMKFKWNQLSKIEKRDILFSHYHKDVLDLVYLEHKYYTFDIFIPTTIEDLVTNGYYTCLLYLIERYQHFDISYNNDNITLFNQACFSNHLNIAKLLQKTFYLDLTIHKYIYNLFDTICDHGYLSIAIYLWKYILTYKLTQNLVEIYQHIWLDKCCKSGNLPLVQWFLSQKEVTLTDKDIKTTNRILNRSLQITKWITSNYKFTVDEIKPYLIRDNFESFKYLIINFKFPNQKEYIIKDITDIYNIIYHIYQRYGNISNDEDFNWFIDYFEIDLISVIKAIEDSTFIRSSVKYTMIRNINIFCKKINNNCIVNCVKPEPNNKKCKYS